MSSKRSLGNIYKCDTPNTTLCQKFHTELVSLLYVIVDNALLTQHYDDLRLTMYRKNQLVESL